MKKNIVVILVTLFVLNNTVVYGQFHFFKQNNDSCYCNDLKIIGVVQFDTLTDIVPPDNYKAYSKSRNKLRFFRRYNYCTEKSNVSRVMSMNKKEYLRCILEDDVYITAQWPDNILKYFVKPCAPDSLQESIKYTLEKGFCKYKGIGNRYKNGSFYNFDYQNKIFLLIQMNTFLYNRIVIGFNYCDPGFILPEISEQESKSTFVKILIPITLKKDISPD